MDFSALDRLLRDSADDLALSHQEKFELRELGQQLDAGRVRYLRNRAFDIARDAMANDAVQAADALRWLEQVIKTLDVVGKDAPIVSSAYFSPGEACLRKLRELMGNAQQTVDICVFTIADDRLAEDILACSTRGIAVRVVSDNDKQYDTGSDIARLIDGGIAVRMDRSAYHMHHKFALFDGRMLANGSFNWTRSATSNNDENLVVTNDANLVRLFAAQFETLWQRFSNS